VSVVSRALDGLLARNSIENPAVPLTSTTLLDYLNIRPAASGVSVNEKKSLGMSAVWRAVNLISAVGGSLPLHAFAKVDGSTTPIRKTTGNAATLLDNPHPDMTPFELWGLAYAHRALWGNAYLQKLRSPDGVVRELWPLMPWDVKPGRASDMTKVYEVGGEIALTDREILHIPGFGYDGVCGLSPISAHRQGIGLSLAAEEFGARLFGSGSVPSGILTTDMRLTAEQADTLKARWKAKLAGVGNSHEIAVLDSGSKFQQLTMKPEDSQFIQSRAFQIEEVARIFGIPPHMLMALEKTTSWGTGVEQQTLGWVRFSLAPEWLTPFEQRITRILKPEAVYAKYTLEGLLRGDSAARAAFYKTMWELGVLSTNEIRELEERSPIDGGDTRYVPLNYGPLGVAAPTPQEALDA
jgi:HK97 family phage portal protein